MVDRERSMVSFLNMLKSLEQEKDRVRRFRIFFRDGREMELIFYEKKGKEGTFLKLIKGKKAG